MHARIDVPDDPRDLSGGFPHRFVVDVRFGDTDAMGHANNSRFLTYCESARIAYWQAATDERFALATHGAHGIGRTSFTLQHRITASASDRGPARLVATADDVLVRYDYDNARPQPIP